jgi:putative spermidine/putrescine transport system permease protein
VDAVIRRRRWRVVVLALAALYFLLPLLAAAEFSFRVPGAGYGLANWLAIATDPVLLTALATSLQIAVVTAVVVLALVVPTAVWVRLAVPAVAGALESATILPIVIPPVVLIVGVLQVAPSRLKSTPYLLALEYVVLAMPFAYRSIDAGLRALDLATLVEASRSLGGGWLVTLRRVLLPNLRSAVLSATVLTVALVLGEYTMATLDQYQTFPVWIVNFDQDDARTSVGASLSALIVTWLILLAISMLGGRRKRAGAARPSRSTRRERTSS